MSREEIKGLSERLLSFANHIDRKRCAEATETDADNAREAAQAITALLAENERLERENADLKSSVVTFASIWAVRYARDYGLPEGHIAAEHYDLLERCGARMDSFTRNPPRAALNKDPDQ